MRCNKMTTLAALTGVTILAMPIAAHAQALGVRVGNLAVSGPNGTGGIAGVSLGGIAGLGSSLGSVGATVGGPSVASINLPSIATTGPVVIGTPGINATVLGANSLATVSVAGVTPGTTIPIISINPVPNPGVNVNPGGVTNIVPVTLGGDSFFSSGNASNALFRMSGGGGGGGGGASASADGGAESSAQICERVLRRPGSFQRHVVQQCRRIVAQLDRRR